MLLWMEQNLATVVVGILVLLVLGGVICNMVRNKKLGKSSCGCSGCSGCKGCGGCGK